MDFKPIALEDRNKIEALRQKYGDAYSAYAFASLFLWKNSMRLSVWVEDDLYVVKSDQEGHAGYFFPCGSGEAKRAFLNTLEKGARLLYISPSDKQLLETEYAGQYRILDDRGAWEYIYNRSKHIAMQGHEYRRIRGRVKKYEAAGYYSKLIDDENVAEAEKIAIKWLAMHERLPQDMDTEGTLAAIKYRKELGLHGVLAYSSDNVPVAFSFGSFLDEKHFDSHVTKSLVPNLEIYFKYSIACMMPEKTEFFNLEEDLDLEGLREHKLELRPCRFNKFAKGEKIC